MAATICGIDCSECGSKDICEGCMNTGGNPFGGGCVISSCCISKGRTACGDCAGSVCELKTKLIDSFNSLGISDMTPINDLNALRGQFINLEFSLPSGQKVKFLNNEKIYLGNQISKADGRCYGLAADENYLLVCEYGENGADPSIIVYKKLK